MLEANATDQNRFLEFDNSGQEVPFTKFINVHTGINNYQSKAHFLVDKFMLPLKDDAHITARKPWKQIKPTTQSQVPDDAWFVH